MIDVQNPREIALFNCGVLSYVLMLLPWFEYAVLIPGILYLWLPISFLYCRLWIPRYINAGRKGGCLNSIYSCIFLMYVRLYVCIFILFTLQI
jgi:hypothetical protein